jgi:hypothetical protein
VLGALYRGRQQCLLGMIVGAPIGFAIIATSWIIR